MEHAFTQTIKAVLQKHFGAQADELFERSLLLQYLQSHRNVQHRRHRQMTKFKKSNPVFYAAYQSARVIVDRGGAQHPAPAPAKSPQ